MAGVQNTIGNYLLLEEIASGAFGRVYRAKHTILTNRIVAIKLMLSVHLSSQKERESFIQEAILLEKLKHPYILPIVDVGIHEGFPYLVTEYAQYGSLRQRLQSQLQKPLPIDEAITILSQIAQALHYAHQSHVIHRDLKPENILFNVKHEALLADFGIATVMSSLSIQQATIVGTPAYMAPEQFQGKVSTESDQYALACIAFELFTGKRLFEAPDFISMGIKHLMEQPASLKLYNNLVPTHIEQAIHTALAKDRVNRHADVLVFMAALQPAQKSSQEWMKEGRALCDLEQYEESLVAFEQAIRLNPNNVNVYQVKGFALFVLKRYEEALAAFDLPFHLDPNDDDTYDDVAYQVKGLALCNLKRYAEAKTAFDQAIHLNSNDYDPYIYSSYRNKGSVLEKLGRDRVAQQAYEKAQQIKDGGSYSLPKINVQTENHTIAIIGDNCSAGVTTYIGSLLHELREGKLERRYSNISQGALYKASEFQFYRDYYVTLFLNKQKFMATMPGFVPEPLIYEFVIQAVPGKKAKRVNLIFYDSAGEDILDQQQLVKFSSYLFYASGIIFLADPLTMPGIVQRLPTVLYRYNYDLPYSPSDVLNRVLQTLRQSNTETQQKFPIPLALTLSKADLLAFTVNPKERRYSFLSEADRNSPLERRELRNVSNEVRAVIEQMGDKNLLKAAETCSTVEFFAVSATGCPEDVNGLYPFVKPIRCLDPLIWILWQLGVIEATQK